MDLDGVALVVGAGSGIGRQVALSMTSRGVHLLICADLNLEAAKETASLSQSRKADNHAEYKAHALQVDVRDEASVQRIVEEAKVLGGRIDYFVNTAGYGAGGQNPVNSMTLEEYRAMDEVHNIGSFLCVREILEAMLQQEPRALPVASRSLSSSATIMSRGSIVILTSLASEGAFLGVGNYIAAKHAVKGLVQTAALENARKGVRINAVAPSFVSGPMVDRLLDGSPDLKASMLGNLPIGRLADPQEVADAVSFLISASASYINGHTLVVDGGASLQLANTPFTD